MKKITIIFLSVILGTSWAGLLNYSSLSGGNGNVKITQIIASDRARYTATDLMQGQNIDYSDPTKINADAIDKNKILDNLGSLGRITFHNYTSTNVTVKLRVDVSTLVDGLLARFETDPAVVIPQFTVPANGDSIFDSMDTYHLSQTFVKEIPSDIPNSRYDAIQAAAIAQYAQTGELLPPRTYVVKVQVLDVANNVLDVVEASVTQPGVTGKTTLILPQSGSEIPMSNQYPQFIWTTDVRTGVNLKYTFSLYDFKDNDSIVSAIGGIPKFSIKDLNTNTFVYPFSAPSFELGKKYAWKVEAYDGTGRFLMSAYDWFQCQVPRPANLNAPQGEVTNFPVLFSWTGVEGADRYQIYVSTRREFTDYKMYETDGVAYSIDNTDGNFEPGKSYFWKVEAINKAGEKFVANPQIGSFIFNQRLELMRPVDTQVMILPPQFQWSALQGAQGYQLRIADNPGFSPFKEYVVDQTSYQPEASDFFAFDKTYFWKVQALSNTGGKWGLETPPASFKSPQRDIPFIMSPLGDELPSITQVQFTWQNVNWAKSYEVFFADNREMKNPKILKANASPFLVSDAGLEWAKNYFWQVLPYDEANQNYNKKSEIGSFKTMGRKAPALIAPLGDEISNLLTIGFNWEKIAWASKYQLLIADNRDMLNARMIDAFPPFNWQNDGLVRLGKTYFWQVIPADDQGQTYGLKSDVMTFRTKPIPAIDIILPNVINVSDVLNISWSPIDGAAQCQVFLSENDPEFGNATVFYSTSRMYTIPADKIKEGTRYFIKVVALDKDGQVFGPSSKVGSVYVNVANKSEVRPAVVVYPVGKINESNPVIKWTEVVSADSYQVSLLSERDRVEAKQTLKGREIEMSKLMAGRPGDAYSVAVLALDSSGKSILDNSKSSSFTLPLAAIRLLDPVGKKVVGNEVNLKWRGDKIYEEYKVLFYKEGHVDDLKTLSTKEQVLEVKGLSTGTYRWYVVGMWKGEELMKTDPAPFAVISALVTGKITLLDPVNKSIRDSKVMFTWSPVDGVDEYKVRVGKGLEDAKEYKTKEKSFELTGLESNNYNWQVVGVKDGKDVLMSAIAAFKFEFIQQVGTADQKVTEDKKPTYVEATPQDFAKFAGFITEYLKANGAANLMEGMHYDDLVFDGKKEKINQLLLQEMIDGTTEIKYIKVR